LEKIFLEKIFLQKIFLEKIFLEWIFGEEEKETQQFKAKQPKNSEQVWKGKNKEEKKEKR